VSKECLGHAASHAVENSISSVSHSEEDLQALISLQTMLLTQKDISGAKLALEGTQVETRSECLHIGETNSIYLRADGAVES
jgi:hypothetical protein